MNGDRNIPDLKADTIAFLVSFGGLVALAIVFLAMFSAVLADLAL